MPISINWGAKIINVPIDSLEFVSTDIYKLDINTFRLALKALEESEDGMAFPDTHRHNTEVDVAGITLARVVEIINGYTVTFEDGQYLVTLYGANSNISDVINFNQVSVRAVTSAGLLVSVQGSGVTEQDKADIASAVWGDPDAIFLKDIEGGRWKIENNQMKFYKADNMTVVATFDLFGNDGKPTMQNVFERKRT